MTTAYPYDGDSGLVTMVPDGVYAPQEDSRLLVDTMDKSGLALGSRVADLCTGSGVAAINAAAQGASSVSAFDICPRAVRCARANAEIAGASVEVHLGSWARAAEFGPFDLLVCNPPYVPHDPALDTLPASVGPARAWDAGWDGRMVLDPLCEAIPDLLADGGSALIVQSEFAEPRKTLEALSAAGLDADVVAWEWIPFGPVLTARAQWLEDTGRLQPGRREEELLVIRADKP
ncbi:HemK2/MTQ2 family protein methyltransferase [Mycolicibacterium bacteremicum]|uniref:HemK2/MTQ2 family protein methyltransferase n=1 Tax=Mycolicibacterium bacteremicum TaxID=564198 RepID=UPI0026EABD1A|nr:HemK2/MTQ2 family protein methyltransferase [Mycolicibacterium bacteremicum]